MRYAKYLIIFVLLFIGNIALSGDSVFLVEEEDIVPNPLQVGEKLTYSIRWKKLPAGKRTDWIVKEEIVNGKDTYHIQSEMKTRALFRVYNFQNQQETYFNPITLSPVRFQNRVKDRGFRATVKTEFREGKAEYERISRPKSKAPQKREAKVLEIPPGTQDELSLIYFLRSKQFVLGETYFFPLLVKGKVLKATLTVERKEFVKNKKLGNVRTIVLRTSEGGRFWITDDERRLPVKIETESKIGAIKANLTEIEIAN
ncbi:MAG: DUF3108 domain-containing protein [Candidatus Poribacteria bacterium]|nr:DUF3108 domain-containing protein [Candidatus Poribacteria bacterium]